MEIIRVSDTWQRAAVCYLRINAFVKGQNIPLEMEFDEHDGEETRYILLMENNEPVATARLHIVDAETAKIERVCVAAEYRGQGIGRKLIEAAEAWAKEHGTKKTIITSQTQAVGFYESLNYVADYSIQYDSEIPIVYTEKYL